MVHLELEKSNVIDVAADVLILKHAQGFHGADEAVYLRLLQANVCDEDSIQPKTNESTWIESKGSIAAENVVFIGTPALRDFRYREVRSLSRRAIQIIAASKRPVPTIATTIHGAGFGLDVEESFQAMIQGFQQGLVDQPIAGLEKIIFVERNSRRFETLTHAMEGVQLLSPTDSKRATTPPKSQVAEPSETKKAVFVAMPFSDAFEDVYQFGIYQTVRKCGLVCEKVDESVYAGSIVDRIIDGIKNCEFVIADLTEERPNVYLEVGYAWGLNKPVLLVAREGQKLHFDLSHHKCIFYPTIGKLADQLEKVIRGMFPSLSKP